MTGEVEEGRVIVPESESEEVETTEEVLCVEGSVREFNVEDLGGASPVTELLTGGKVAEEVLEAILDLSRFIKDSLRALRRGEGASVLSSDSIRGLGGWVSRFAIALVLEKSSEAVDEGSVSPALRSPALTALAMSWSNFSLAPTKRR